MLYQMKTGFVVRASFEFNVFDLYYSSSDMFLTFRSVANLSNRQVLKKDGIG
jgi:hypothetical protein